MCFHTQWEVIFQIKFYPKMKFYSFHPGMKLTCKQKFFQPRMRFRLGYMQTHSQKSNFVHHFRLLIFLLRHFRSSRPEVFCIKGVHRNFGKFTGKRLCQSLVFNKVASWPATLLKKRHSHRSFAVNFSKFLRTPLLTNTSGGCFWHFQTWCYEKEQNRNYSTNLTTIKCGLNESNINQLQGKLSTAVKFKVNS